MQQQLFANQTMVKKILLWLLVCTTCLTATPALAVLRQHHSLEGLRYHAHYSLQDLEGNAWQILVFPDVQLSSEQYSLRLVGFPGLAEFVHPHPLEIVTSTGKILLAGDRFAQTAPAPNVGQYDVTDILPQLVLEESLRLSVPLQNKELFLTISQAAIVEWEWLLEEK